MTQKKEAIGTAPCVFAGCGCTMKIFRFEPQSDRPSMFKGRLYAVCETNGRYGADGKPASQEYLLGEKVTIWGAKKPEGEPAQKPENPQEKPAVTAPAAAAKQPAKPAQEPAPKPAQSAKQPAPKPDGWGFFR